MSLGVASDPMMQRLFADLTSEDKGAFVAWYLDRWNKAFPDEPLAVPPTVEEALKTKTPHPIVCYVPVGGAESTSSLPQSHREVRDMTIEAQLMDSLGYALSSWDKFQDDPFVTSYDTRAGDGGLYLYILNKIHE
jgi:hypothetical protein